MASIKPASDLPALLRRSHAQMYRIALALCGDRQHTEAVVEKVLQQSITISKRWETDEQAVRWFSHYTLLLSRGAKPGAGPLGAGDVLLSIATDPESATVVRAIRQLPMQQREAFLLHHGEAMELRQMATAMDCSSAAAANHLVAAVKSLKDLNLIGLGDFTAHLPALLKQLVPGADALERDLRRVMEKQRKRARLRQAMVWAGRAVIIAAIAWLLWWIWRTLGIRIVFE